MVTGCECLECWHAMTRIDLLTELMLSIAVLLGYLPLAPWLQRFPAFAVPVALILVTNALPESPPNVACNGLTVGKFDDLVVPVT